MLKLFSSIERVTIVALLAALAYATYQIVIIESELKEANKKITTKSLEIDNLTMQAEFLTQSVKLTEKQNAKLISERNTLSRLNNAYQLEVSSLTSSLHKTQTEINKLRESSDEAIKTWANDSVPCDAVRLLKYARASECDKDGGTDRVRVPSTAGRISIKL